MVVVGVVAGPGTAACIQRGDFAQCMSETFFGGVPVQTAETEAGEDIAVVAETEESEPVAETPVVEEPEPAPVPETIESEPPTFGLVRVEPDGSAVIAGTATPSGAVEIFAQEDIIGTETAESSGDWVFITAEPLPAGGVELRVRDVETDSFATTSVVVVVEEDRSTAPLVVASEPGQASDILQGIDQPEPETPAQEAIEEETSAIASVDEPTVAEEAAGEPVLEVASAPEVAVGEPAAAESAATEEPAVPEDAAPAAEEPAVAQEVTEEPVLEVASAPEVAAQEPAAVQAAAPEEPAAAGDVAAIDEPVVTEEPAETAPVEPVAQAPAAVEPASEAPVLYEPVAEEAAVEAPAAEEPAAQPVAEEPAIAIVPPTIDAVEIDGDRNFFAGAGTDGLTVRLYVENRPVGSTQVADGRWLVEAINVLVAASQRVRADLIGADGAVAGRAEVDFVLELPETVEEAPIVVAEDTAPVAQPEPAETPASTEEPAASEAPVPVEEPAAVEEAVEIAAQEPVAAEQPAPVEEPVVAEEPAIAAPEAEPAEVPTLVGVTDGERTTSGLAIIRRGDNLWTIARRVYGEGLRYTQIFEANADQIRDPDLIYPGQVFDLPDTDAVIGGDEDDDAA